MDSKIFGNLNTYYEVYVALSKRPLSKENLVRNLRDAGKIASSASEYGKKAVNGEIAFISGTEEKLELDQAALMQFLLEACGDFNLEAEIHPKRKKKEEETIAKLTTQLVEAQQDKQKTISAAIPAEMDKKVLVPKTISSEPVEVLAKDFFYDCQTAHCGRCKPHFDFGAIASPIVPYRNSLQTLCGMTADCRSFV